MTSNRFAWLCASLLAVPFLHADDADGYSAHSQPTPNPEVLPGPSDASELLEHEARQKSLGTTKGKVSKASSPVIDKDDFWVFGYIQSQNVLAGARWQSLTDVGTLFVEFDSSGNISVSEANNFLNRNSDLMAGGAADNAGVGVHVVILNSGFNNAVTESVMNNTTNRNNLISEIETLLEDELTTNSPGYVAGVSFDLEPFSWNATAATNLETFFDDLRTLFDTDTELSPLDLEISWYTDPTPSSTQYSNLGNYIDSIDKILYSMYDFGTGSTPRDPSDFDATLSRTTDYLEDYGVPPEKLVPLISTYSRQFPDTTSYGVAGSGSSTTGLGFTDALYNTTLRPSPYTRNYVTGDEASWYTDGTNVVVNPLVEGLEFKIRQALSYQDSSSIYAGRKLGGVGFWSLMWLLETSSYDFNQASTGSFYRTYTHPYEICQIALSPPGTQRFLIEGFESANPRWEDPNTGPDDVGDTDFDSFQIWEASPGGAGAPASTTNAVRVAFNFEQATGNQLFFRHEILANPSFTSVPDFNATGGFLDATSEIQAYVHAGTSGAPSALSDTSIAIVVLDADGELERGPLTALTSAGWQTVTFDLTATATAFSTTDPAFGGTSGSGDGTIDTAGGGARDIAFAGFLITDEDGLAGSRSVIFDEVSYVHKNPGGMDYVINEVRYDGSSDEYVEIYGPAGSLPSGFQLVLIEGGTNTRTPYTVTGSIPNDGGGFGYFVVGDPTVANVDSSLGFSNVSDELSSSNPSAVQLYNSSTGGVYDSFVYEAFGGLDELIRQEQLGVVDEGYPWAGRVAGGTDSLSQKGAIGRYPDGTDTDVNYDDFALQLPTPGTSNGGAVDITGGPVTYDFSTAPATGFQTFQTFGVTSSGVGASPSGGNVHRCVDTTGGGVMTFIGDKALGTTTNGYHVAGEIYLPGGAEPAQAVAVGFCGTQGSAFFSSSRAGNSYENGYMLIYENVAGVGLDDGRADHAGTIEFVHASHDNQDGNPVELLGSAAAPVTGAWTTFQLIIDPSASPGSQLVATVGGVTIYSGAIPAGGPTSGAVTVGFRENHGGAPASNEGTWIDNLRIGQVGTVPVELDVFGVE